MNIKLNKLATLLMFQHFGKNEPLPENIEQIISAGISLQSSCIVLNYFYDKNRHLKLVDFYDETQFECTLNQFHLDDYVESDFISLGIQFAIRLIENCEQKFPDTYIVVILSRTEYGANIKIHKERNDQSWLGNSEMNNFEEPLFVMTTK